MKLITEYTDRDIQTIAESTEDGTKRYFIRGPFLQAEMKNRNGRVYPMEILGREVARYVKEHVNDSRAVGELGHPDTPTINYDRASHKILSLIQDGKTFIGNAEVMTDLPMGGIVKGLINHGVKMGVSSRGLGTLRRTDYGNVVGEDFYLATAADIVHDPSAPNAFVEGIYEGKEWVWENGVLTEQQIAAYKRQLDGAPKKQAEPRRLVESKAFAKFLRDIRVSIVAEGYQRFANKGSALRAADSSNPRNLPCPTCKEPNKLTPKDKRLGYQCDDCARRDEGVW